MGKGAKMLKEFKEFAMKGNVLDMAIGIVIGAAFGTIIGSLVADVIMPPIGLLLGNVDFSNLFLVLKEGKVAGPYASLAAAKAAGAVSMNIGVFINTIINFILLAFAIFLLVRSVNRMKRKEQAPPPVPTTKDCPHCFTGIPIKATRCPHCTSELKGN
jgi:large conductance mechanosensitive channel